MPDTPETPIVVNPNPILAQVNAGLRDLTTVAAAVPTVTALLGKRDVSA
jgi:hypothetical protein